KRDVTLAYVVDAPLWKTAYRVVLPEDGKEKGLLQGWAVVENMTANDWNSVDLTLVSGNPVTFREELYQSYHVQRPEIPVQVFGRVMPRVDTGSINTASMMEMESDAASPARSREKKAPMKMGGMRAEMADAPVMSGMAAPME